MKLGEKHGGEVWEEFEERGVDMIKRGKFSKNK